VDLTIGSDGNEDIAGLDVLVEDADGVGSGDGIGDVGGDLNALVQWSVWESTDVARPVVKVTALGPFAFEKEGRLVELDVIEACDVVSIAQGILEQAKEGHLALEAAESFDIEAEFEDVALLGAFVAREPYLAEPAFAETAFQGPADAAGDG